MAELDSISTSTRRFTMAGKGMKSGSGKSGSKGFMGGGKNSGFVTTPMNAPKKGFKGK